MPHQALTPGSLAGTEAQPRCCHLPCAQGSKEGQGGKQKPPHSRGHGRKAGAPAGSAMGRSRVGNPCSAAGLAGAFVPRCDRATGIQKWQGPCSPPCQGLLGKLWDPHALMGPLSARAQTWGSAHGSGSRPAQLAVPQACCGSRPAQHLSLQPCVMGYPKTLLGGEIQAREVAAMLHAHRQSTG